MGLFWSTDERFLQQFAADRPLHSMKFQPFSKYPPTDRDVSFWLPEAYSPNHLADLVREIAGDLVESISLVDEFTHPKHGRTSHCYRIVYRSMDKTFTTEEVNEIQDRVRQSIAHDLKGELR